jgi:hypothetical protein
LNFFPKGKMFLLSLSITMSNLENFGALEVPFSYFANLDLLDYWKFFWIFVLGLVQLNSTRSSPPRFGTGPWPLGQWPQHRSRSRAPHCCRTARRSHGSRPTATHGFAHVCYHRLALSSARAIVKAKSPFTFPSLWTTSASCSSAPSVERRRWEPLLPPRVPPCHRRLGATSSQAGHRSKPTGRHATQSASLVVRNSPWAAVSGQGAKPSPPPQSPRTRRVTHRPTHQQYRAANRARAAGHPLQFIGVVAKPSGEPPPFPDS